MILGFQITFYKYIHFIKSHLHLLSHTYTYTKVSMNNNCIYLQYTCEPTFLNLVINILMYLIFQLKEKREEYRH